MMTHKKLAVVLGVLLLVSLAGNFFQAGLLLGKTAERRGMTMSMPDLPPADKKLIDTTIKNSSKEIERFRKEMAETREDIRDALRANDKKELEAALQKQGALKSDFLVYMQKVRAETVQKLSPEARDILEKSAMKPRGRPHPAREDYPPFIWEDIDLP